jgi:hypothetical protein
MRFLTAIACATLVLGSAAPASAQSVSLEFNNGRVTLNAQNAPLRSILTEWSRLGGTQIVNGERVAGAPVTIELTDVPEREAIDVLLRSVAGYILTSRQQPGSVSTLGGVVILATSSAPRVTAPVTFGTATVQPAQAFSEPRNADADDRAGSAAPVIPVAIPNVIRPGAQTGSAAFGQTDQPPPAQQTPARPVTTLQTLPGTARPGEITPVQPQPGQPGQPGQPPPSPNQR